MPSGKDPPPIREEQHMGDHKGAGDYETGTGLVSSEASSVDDVGNDDVGVDPLMWDQNFLDSEKFELLDLAGEYRNILHLLGNTRAKDRAERINKLIRQNKIEWWKQEEREIHEVLGIDIAKRRRIKLIMAKLEARINKKKDLKIKKKAIDLKTLKTTKKVSFSSKLTGTLTNNKAATTSDNNKKTLEEIQAEKVAAFKAKYRKFKKYQHLARPKQIEETYGAAEELQNEKTLDELQDIIISNLKKQAARKCSTAFLNDLNERTNYMKEQRERKLEDAKKVSDSECSSYHDDASVDLSDIKSENESIYWEQKRGAVEDVDVLITNDRLFDTDFHLNFKENLKQLEMCLEAPEKVVQHFEQTEKFHAQIKKKRLSRAAGHN